MEFTSAQKKGALLAGALLALTGIALYFKRQFGYLSDAITSVVGTKVHNIGISNIRFTLFINIKNKGDISATITKQSYHVYANNSLISVIKTEGKIKLKSHGDTVLPLIIEFNPQVVAVSALENLSGILNDKSPLNFLIKGDLSLNAGVISLKNYKFDITMSLAEIKKMSSE